MTGSLSDIEIILLVLFIFNVFTGFIVLDKLDDIKRKLNDVLETLKIKELSK